MRMVLCSIEIVKLLTTFLCCMYRCIQSLYRGFSRARAMRVVHTEILEAKSPIRYHINTRNSTELVSTSRNQSLFSLHTKNTKSLSTPGKNAGLVTKPEKSQKQICYVKPASPRDKLTDKTNHHASQPAKLMNKHSDSQELVHEGKQIVAHRPALLSLSFIYLFVCKNPKK